jgi:myosin-crossreactive antigen
VFFFSPTNFLLVSQPKIWDLIFFFPSVNLTNFSTFREFFFFAKNEYQKIEKKKTQKQKRKQKLA